MLGVGDKLPSFKCMATVSTDMNSAFKEISNENCNGTWTVLFFWPKDFTFVCPTEIAQFGEMNEAFKDMDAQILGCSTDSEYVHLAWRESHPSLKNLPFPMIADIKRELCGALGIIDKEAGVAQRATYIIDPEGTIRFAMVTDMNVGRNAKEVLRVLKALQTDELTPCGWQPGEDVLKAA